MFLMNSYMRPNEKFNYAETKENELPSKKSYKEKQP